jgi:hypothetical protein
MKYIILIILLVSCARMNPKEYPLAGKTSIIKENHEDFLMLLNKWNYLKARNFIEDENVPKVGYQIQDVQDFDELITQCYHYEDKTKEIRVSKKYWKKLSELEKKYILFKQLAICDLDIPLSYKVDPYGTPVSMMYFDMIGEEILKKNWGFYEYSLLQKYPQ